MGATDRPPRLLPSYLAGLRPRHGADVPGTELVRTDVGVDRAHLARYAAVCGFPSVETLPATYPHVLAFPLILRLMVDRDFPFALPGLVHVRNEITQYRPVGPDEPLSLSVRAERLAPHRRGSTVDLVVAVTAGGERVWSERGTYLHREPRRARDQAPGAAPPPDAGSPDAPPDAAPGVAPDAGRSDDRVSTGSPAGEPGAPERAEARVVGDSVRWVVRHGTGRRYAAVSGDRNPIHLSALTARPFGFRTAIAHGMWSAARCLAALSGRLPDTYHVGVDFVRPVAVPSVVGFGARPAGDHWVFAVTDGARRPLLTGAASAI